MIIILSCVLTSSILSNAVLAFFVFRPVKSKKPAYTYDAQALLRDLMSGPALLKVEYVDRGEVLLRSPRHT
jgi:hypothetical protein